MKNKLGSRARWFERINRQPDAIQIVLLGLEGLSHLVAAGQQYRNLVSRRS